MADFSGYPMCKTGDVGINLSSTEVFQLHAEILRRHCRFFAKTLIDDNAVVAKERSKKSGVAIRWRFQLHKNQYGQYTLQTVTNGKRANVAENIGPAFLNDGQSSKDIIDQFKCVLEAVYNRPLLLESVNMGHLMLKVHGILDIAEQLGCIHTLDRTLDSMLVEYGQTLWQAIANDPVQWVDLAARIKSFNILKEVAIHLVGKWSMLSDKEKHKMPAKLLQLCAIKNSELLNLKERVELELIAYYPDEMKRDKASPLVKQTRSSYSNDIILWQCGNVFRQWLAEMATLGQTRHANDGGYQFYHKISQGENAYLDAEAMVPFHDVFAMPTRGQHNLHNQLKTYKEGARPIVALLMANKCNLDRSRHPLMYLTCADFARDEILGLWQAGATLDWTGDEGMSNGRKRSSDASTVVNEHDDESFFIRTSKRVCTSSDEDGKQD